MARERQKMAREWLQHGQALKSERIVRELLEMDRELPEIRMARKWPEKSQRMA